MRGINFQVKSGKKAPFHCYFSFGCELNEIMLKVQFVFQFDVLTICLLLNTNEQNKESNQ